MDNYYSRCSDTNDPLDNFKLPKGKGGDAILFPGHMTNNIKKLKDGNERSNINYGIRRYMSNECLYANS